MASAQSRTYRRQPVVVQCLKVDKYFVDDMLVDKKSLLLIGSMIEMGHKLGYGIIVEGVETSNQLNIIKSLGCGNAQGYLFSKPVNANAISKLLNTRYECLSGDLAQKNN